MTDRQRAFCMGNALVTGVPHAIGKAMSEAYGFSEQTLETCRVALHEAENLVLGLRRRERTFGTHPYRTQGSPVVSFTIADSRRFSIGGNVHGARHHDTAP